MTRLSWPLQQALFARLAGDDAVFALCGGRVTDEPLPRPLEGPAVEIGEESVTPWDTSTDRGAEHVVTLGIVGPVHGFSDLKVLAAAVCDAVEAGLLLTRGRLVSTRLLSATARRTADGARRIDLRFRIVVEDDAQQGDNG